MALPTVFSPILPQDFTLTPIEVNKRFSLDGTTLVGTGSGYRIWDAVHSSLLTPIGDQRTANDPTNSFDGSYQRDIWKLIDHQWYRFPYDPFATLEHSNERFTYKFLNYSASILSCPYLDYGDRIRAGSLEMTSSTYGFKLTDDQNGNIYDQSINTGSFIPRYSVIGYWGFNSIFRKFKYREGQDYNGSVGFTSRTFEPAEESICHNVDFSVGVPINGTGSGMQADFNGDGYILTKDASQFNFHSKNNFTIGFWIKAPVTQSINTSTKNTLISKSGTIYKQVYGINPHTNANNQTIETLFVSQSLQNESTNVYPYAFDFHNSSSATPGRIEFRRSDGIATVTLTTTSSIADGNHHYITATRSGSLVSLYLDGVIHASASDGTKHPINGNALMFGAENFDGKNAFSGSMDEIRFLNYSAHPATIATLANNTNQSLYQTAVVGNVFYRTGNIIVSPHDPKYLKAFKDTWSMAYRGTHTIYQYEVLSRIRKGSFNLSMNPSAVQSPGSDLLIDDFTGSLFPYASGIGYYNDAGELMAVAKLSQPIAMRDDVQINIVARFDA